jgi:hypothetical protein
MIDVWVVDEDAASAGEPVNIDADSINADWIKVVARMKKLRAEHPEWTDAEVRLRAERAHLASIGGDGL